MPSVNFDRSLSIENVPMFHPDVVNNPSSEVNSIRSKIDKADLVLIVTPEYLHNIPAVLKNLFEWTASSGEFHQKKVLPVTLTPLKPRGDYAMQSLLFSLKALNANIMAKLQLYRADFEIDKSIDNKLLISVAPDGYLKRIK
mgnify:CR=1 FL=1